jgi:hypothetical protein
MSAPAEKQSSFTKKKQYSVINHHYIFKTSSKRFKPDLEGLYHPETPEEIALFEHYLAKGLVAVV